jgi:hypothetical protein
MMPVGCPQVMADWACDVGNPVSIPAATAISLTKRVLYSVIANNKDLDFTRIVSIAAIFDSRQI